MALLRAKDLSGFFTEAARSRKNSPLKSLLKYMAADPTLLSLGAGLPHPDMFPIARITASVAQPGCSAADESADKVDVSVAKGASGVTEGLERFLQYGNGRGIASYLDFAREHTARIHKPVYEDWDVVVSQGNTDAFAKTLEMFCERGDTLIVDEWTYPAAIETVGPMGLGLAPVAMDGEGMIPDDLDRVCTSWSGRARPLRAAYMIPTAQNPTGATMSLERKRAIYAVAQKHDLVLIEDDPYYYLQLGRYRRPEECGSGEERCSGLPGVTALIPSLLSLDVDGRVIRLDSFSKILAPGLRCGWVTAPKYIAEKIQFHNETTIQQPSGLSQALVSKLMNEQWGHDGWERHLVQLQREYAVRRDLFVDLCYRHLRGMVEFTAPTAGMFLWLRVLLSPAAQRRQGVMDEIFESMIANHVLLVPGFMFSPLGADAAEARSKPFIRAAFSYAAPADFEPAIVRLAQALAPFTA